MADSKTVVVATPSKTLVQEMSDDFSSAEAKLQAWFKGLYDSAKSEAALLWNDLKAAVQPILNYGYMSIQAALPAYLSQLKASAISLAKQALARFGQDMVGHWSFGWVLSELKLMIQMYGKQFVVSGADLGKATLETIVQNAVSGLIAGTI